MGALSLNLLGPPLVHHAGRLVAFPTRKALALLTYLAVEGGVQSREKIAALLWPESGANHARTTLRSTLALLREALGDPSAHLAVTRDTLAFNQASADSFDVGALRAAAGVARQPGHLDSAEAPFDALEAAVAAWRGDFLDGFVLGDAPEFDDWASLQRESLHRTASAVCSALAQALMDHGAFSRAVEIADRWVARDPLSEVAHRCLIQAYAFAGDRSAALRAYESCRAALATELGITPDPETKALAERVRAHSDLPRRAESPEREGSATPALHATAFVGRASQHRMLVESYRAAAAGTTHAVVLLGEPGIGKTRLASEFAGWARAEGAEVLHGRAHESGGRLSYHPLTEALRRRIEVMEQPGELLTESWLVELARLLPELHARVARLPAPAPLPDTEARTRLFEAVGQLGHALASRSPLVLLIDDLQWADIASLDLLVYVVRRWSALGTPALVVLTVRTEELTSTIGDAGGEHTTLAGWLATLGREAPLRQLRLAPLTREDTGELIRAFMAGGEALGRAATEGHWAVAEALRTWLYEETDGQPFFLVQTLSMLLERGALRRGTSGAWELSPPARSASFPSGVRDLVQSRLSRLSTAAHLACTACAVLGDGCDFEQVCHVSGLVEPDDLRAVEELLLRGLVSEREGRYIFVHDTIRAVAYAEVSETRRRLFHRRALAALEAAHAPAATQAHHALVAGLTDAAIRLSLAAADEAMQLFAVPAAIHHYEQARALLEEQRRSRRERRGSDRWPLVPSIHLGLGKAYELVSAWEQARTTYGALLTMARQEQDVGAECDALSRLATVEAQGFFNLPGALALLDGARTAAERSGDDGRLADTEWSLAQVSFYGWELERSTAHGERALALAVQRDNRELEARSRNIVAYNAMMMARLDEAMAQAEAARALFAALGNRAMEADCLSIIAIVQVHTGDLLAGIEVGRTGVAIGREIENPWGLANCAHPLARGLLDCGRWGEALAVAQAGVAAARNAGHPPTLVFNLLALGAVFRAHGALAQAGEAHGEAHAIAEAMHHPFLREWAAIEQCADAAQAGDWTSAAACAQQALALRRPDRVYVGTARWLETEALVRAGLGAKAAADLEQRGTTVYPRLALQLERAWAVLAASAGDEHAAAAHLTAAGVLADQLGLRYDRWQIDVTLAAALANIDHAESGRYRARAAATAEELLASVTAPELRAQLRASVESP